LFMFAHRIFRNAEEKKMSLHHQMTGGATTYVVSRGAVVAFIVVFVSAATVEWFVPDFADVLRTYWIIIAAAVLIACVAWQFVKLRFVQEQQPALPKMFVPVPFTEADLAWYDGAKNSTAARLARGGTTKEDYETAGSAEKLAAAVARGMKLRHPLPLYDNLVFVCVKGVVFNVSPDYYGPGAGYSAFAAKDSSRQLGKVVVGTTECNADWTTMNDKHLKVLADWEARYREKYCIAGWLVPEDESYFSRGAQLDP
jgi:hypothetical protein